MTFLKVRSKETEAPSRRNQGASLSDKRVIPPRPRERRISGTLHLPAAHIAQPATCKQESL